MSFDGRQPLTRRELREQEVRGARKTEPAKSVVVVRRPAPAKKKRVGSTLLSMAAMVFAAALLVGVSVPANALFGGAAVLAPGISPTGQSVEVSADAQADATERSAYTITSYAEILKARYGNRNYSYTVGRGAVQWPFPYAVPVSDGFGPRIAPCRGCSTDHQGTDFTPGAGSAIYAIADGVVTYTEVSDRGYGNHVWISHVVNGEKVASLYAHMQMNSSPLAVGDVIKVGDFVGLVGDTGASVGAHLHLEIHANGVAVDPFAWLKANAAS